MFEGQWEEDPGGEQTPKIFQVTEGTGVLPLQPLWHTKKEPMVWCIIVKDL